MDFNKHFLFNLIKIIFILLAVYGFLVAFYLFPPVFLNKAYYLPSFIQIVPDNFMKIFQWLTTSQANEASFYASLFIGFFMFLIYQFLDIKLINSSQKRKLSSRQINSRENRPDWQQKIHSEFNAAWSQSEKSAIHPVIYNLLTVLLVIGSILLIEWLVGI